MLRGNDNLWLNNPRVWIAGGAGLTGPHIAVPLVKENAAEILVLDNFVPWRRDNLFIEHA